MSPRLGYAWSGSGADCSVVLSGSLGTTIDAWQPQLGVLDRSRRLLRIDHLGHGGSVVPPGPYRIDQLGTEAVALLDELNVSTVDWVGLSLGGMLGLWIAAHHPRRIGCLVLLCSSARPERAASYRQRAERVRDSGVETVADSVVERWFTSAFREARPEVVRAHRSMLVATPVEGYAGCCEAIAGIDLRAELSSVSAPTLVVAAEGDTALPVAESRYLADQLAEARLVVLTNAAHLASVEQADAVNALVTEHLTQRR